MNLSTLFTKAVITADPDDTLAAVARQMQDHDVGSVVITQDGRPVGILTDRDLALGLGARGVSPQAPAKDVMTRHVLAVPEETGIFTATKYVREAGVRRLPIVDRDDRLAGIVTADDLLRCLALELYNLAEGIARGKKESAAGG